MTEREAIRRIAVALEILAAENKYKLAHADGLLYNMREILEELPGEADD